MFEIRLGAKYVSVTKSKLFELARTGLVPPDALVTIDGTKVYADSIKGIVFGNGPSAAAPPPVIAPEVKPHTFPDLGKSGVLNAPNTTDEPFFLVLPPRKRESMISGLGNTVQGLFSRSDTSEERDSAAKSMMPAIVFGIICLFGLLGFVLWNIEWTSYGTIHIEGMVTLDGEPVRGVSITLHPRNEKGSVAGGITKKSGKFTVLTDIVKDPADPMHGKVPMVSGALPGEYDVTFYKLKPGDGLEYDVPKRYGDVKTSKLAPIKVARKGKKTFLFELTTETDEKNGTENKRK
jgi:hypothetical protein